MSDLFWPGDERAGDLFSAGHLVACMVRVETAWLQALTATGIAPATDVDDVVTLTDAEVEQVALGAEAGGTPVLPLVTILRGRLHPRDPVAAGWVHRGLTSQDVLDTALVLCVRDVLDRLRAELGTQVDVLSGLADTHRRTLMVGRTLAQSAVPISFGLKAGGWLHGVLDAAEDVERVRGRLVSQLGGAAGTMAATVDLAAAAGLADPPRRAEAAAAHASQLLGLRPAVPWHTARGPITSVADALVRSTGAWGPVATDVITLSRPEIAELGERAVEGRGASSTMAHKRNPVLSVLVRRAALSAPALGAQLHLAAADAGDERPAGAWHTEWAALRTLARQTTVAASQTSELLAGLVVHGARMRATLQAAVPGVLAERLVPRLAPVPGGEGPQLGTARAGDLVLGADDAGALRRAVAGLVPDDVLDQLLDPLHYLGTADLTIDALLQRARTFLQEDPA